jgi:iron complex transport system ATP-binding protein
MILSAASLCVDLNGRRIVSEASLVLRAGELTGLIGPNGAGKSTLMRAMAGLAPASAGEVRLGDRLLREAPLRERARRVAFLPQEARIHWRMPVRDVVMLGRGPHRGGVGGPTKADDAAVDRAMRAASVDGLVDRDALQLSAGERARVLLARALAVEAGILLVDEPAAALDPLHQLEVMDLLQRQAREGVAVLAVIHDLAMAARYMDRLVLMGKGRVIADGPPAEVLTEAAVRSAFGVTLLRGEHDGEPWALPWAAIRPAGDHGGGST